MESYSSQFSKYLTKFGYRLQYLVFEIRNTDRILENTKTKIIGSFENDSNKVIL